MSAHVVPDSFIGSLILSELWRPIAKWYLRFAYNRARLIIAVSPMVKTELEKIGVSSRIEVLCNSINRERFKKDDALKTQQKNYRFHLMHLSSPVLAKFSPEKELLILLRQPNSVRILLSFG